MLEEASWLDWHAESSPCLEVKPVKRLSQLSFRLTLSYHETFLLGPSELSYPQSVKALEDGIQVTIQAKYMPESRLLNVFATRKSGSYLYAINRA